jgi:DNA-binding MarR family transcriptional regulator
MEEDVVTLDEIVGYRLDMARCAALRSVHRLLADTPFRPADTTALLLVRERPGCDQTTLGRALAGNRSVGMKVAARLEARGLLTRGEGRNRRSKGLYLTPMGEAALADLLARHDEAERRLAAALELGEREMLLALLGKIEAAVLDEEAALPRETAARSDEGDQRAA